MTTISKPEFAFVQTVKAMAEQIRQAGPRGIGSGVLYSAVMRFMTLDAYEKSIALLIAAGVVRREHSSLLVWNANPIQRRD